MIARTRSSSTRTSPISAAGPTTTFSQPGGRPASVSSSAKSSAEKGVCEAGLRTTGQPAASAGAILWATRLRGKLNGEIAATTPSGCRSVKASLPAPACEASIGTISPASLRASTAAIVKVDIARDASTRAALSGFPASAAISWATSSCRRPSCPATRTRISARLCAGSGSRSAASAASTARLVSAAPAFATRPTSSPEYGERTSTQSPVSTHSPAISSRRSIAVVAMRRVYETAGVVEIPDVQYARSGGVAVAYQVVGDGPSDLVFLPGSCRTSTRSGSCRCSRAHAAAARSSRADHLQHARDGALGPPAQTHDRGADGRRPGRHGRRRQRARDAARLARRPATPAQSSPPRTRSGSSGSSSTRLMREGREREGDTRGADAREARAGLAVDRERWGEREYLEDFARRMNPSGDDPAYVDWFVWTHRPRPAQSRASRSTDEQPRSDVRDVLPAIRVPDARPAPSGTRD